MQTLKELSHNISRTYSATSEQAARMRAFDNPQAHVIINRHLRNGEREVNEFVGSSHSRPLNRALDMFALQSRLFPL